jgi:hypothetical protein
MPIRRLAVLALVIAAAAPAAADEYQDAQALYRQGQRAEALERLDSHLAKQPRDARARFLRGVILTEQNRRAEAIEAFTALTQDFPELPEPYNNLAVLYAGQGDYNRARDALDMAIRTHPSYATAYENLGDVYAAMASQAYDKALELDRSSATARTKLELIRELLPPRRAGEAAGAAAAAAAGAVPATSPVADEATARSAPPAAAAPGAEERAEPAPAAAGSDVALTQPSPESASQAPPAAAAEDRTQAIVRTVEDWARAWSRGDADAYLAFYAPDFRTPPKESRAQWEATRRERLAKAKNVSVKVIAPEVSFPDADRATVTFRQEYASRSFKGSGRKTLELVLQGERWLIQQETIVAR